MLRYITYVLLVDQPVTSVFYSVRQTEDVVENPPSSCSFFLRIEHTGRYRKPTEFFFLLVPYRGRKRYRNMTQDDTENPPCSSSFFIVRVEDINFIEIQAVETLLSSSFFFRHRVLCPTSRLQRLTLTLLMHARLFWCFHNPPNFDIPDCRIPSLHYSPKSR